MILYRKFQPGGYLSGDGMYQQVFDDAANYVAPTLEERAKKKEYLPAKAKEIHNEKVGKLLESNPRKEGETFESWLERFDKQEQADIQDSRFAAQFRPSISQRFIGGVKALPGLMAGAVNPTAGVAVNTALGTSAVDALNIAAPLEYPLHGLAALSSSNGSNYKWTDFAAGVEPLNDMSFGEKFFLDPLNFTPAVGAKVVSAGLPFLKVAKKLNLSKVKKIASEIDWGKWNKEIPGNKKLIDEYNAIEKAAKADGTWMKNTDGGKFKGTPEQFIQQRSKNFKKAFGKSIVVDKAGNPKIVSHTTDNVFDTFDMSKFGKTDDGFHGKGIYFADYAENVPNIRGNWDRIGQPYGYPATRPVSSYGDIEVPSYIKIEKPMPDIGSDFYGRSGPGGSPIHGMFDEAERLWKGKYDGTIGRPNTPFAEYVTQPENIKSAIGNNGMFDMTNPNIYKSVAPVVGGAGLLYYGQNNKKNQTN